MCLQLTFGYGWLWVNVIVDECVFRDVYLNLFVGIGRGEGKPIVLVAFVLHLVIMFPGNSNFDKRDLSKLKEATN